MASTARTTAPSVVPNSERYDPVLSSEYFEDQQDIAVDSRGGFFRIYVSGLEKGAKPPSIVFVLLHGGGMSALTWAQMAKALMDAAKSDAESWPNGFAAGGIAVVAPDLRGHGDTWHGSGVGCAEDTDLNIETLSRDMEALLDIMFSSSKGSHGSDCDGSSASNCNAKNSKSNSSESSSSGQGELEKGPAANTSTATVKARRQRIILVGHSLGGAVATHLCARLRARRATKAQSTHVSSDDSSSSSRLALSRSSRVELKVCGLALLDAIEGTAIEAIDAGHIERAVTSMPPTFPDVRQAIAWAHHSGGITSLLAARVATPPRLLQQHSHSSTPSTPATPSVPSVPLTSESTPEDRSSSSSCSTSASNTSTVVDVKNSSCSRSSKVGEWQWRTNLLAARSHWRGWFEGLSALFLAQPVPKLVAVSGAHHMLDDGPLLVAQMQGRFQFMCLRGCGHHVQEDAPHELAHALLAFAATAAAQRS